jgi:hypothetical protein
MARLTFFAMGALFGVAVILTGGALMAADPGEGEDVPLITGDLWLQSSAYEQRSYLVGAGNLMAIEYLYQQEAETKPTDDQTIMTRMWNGLDGATLEQLEKTITSYYEQDEKHKKDPVMQVIWEQVAKPRLANGK